MKMENATKPLLSISLLTSNRKDTIRKCLDSLDTLRKNVSSELIIVDTGCDEEMRSIISEYTDHIVAFTWINDFAAARNAGLYEAKGEWFLFIDDDEWFENTDEIEQFFLTGEYKEYERADYAIRNYMDFEGANWQEAWVGRMIRLDKGVCFQGKIHEYLPDRKKRKFLNSYVHHYGYAFHTDEEREAHSRRNIVLLEETIKKEPNKLRWYIQLVQEYIGVREYEKAYRVSKKGLSLFKGDYHKNVVNWIAALAAGFVISCLKRNMYAEAKEFIRKQQYEVNSDLCKLVLYGANTEICFREMDFQKTVNYGMKYARQYQMLEEMPSEKRNEQMILIADEYYRSRVRRNSILCYLFVAALRLGDTKPLERYFELLDFSGERLYLAADFLNELLNAIERFESPYFVKVVSFLLKQGLIVNELIRLLVKRDMEAEPGFERLVTVFAQVDLEISYLWYFKLRDALANTRTEQIGKIREKIENMPYDRWKFIVEDIVPYMNRQVLKAGVEQRNEFLKTGSDKEQIFLETAMPVLEKAGLAEKKYTEEQMQELYALADSLCENAVKLWEQGEEASAKSILLQIKKLVPDYKRVDQLFQITTENGNPHVRKRKLPTIYIRTCAYNAKDTIAQTIESVLSQTYQQFIYYILDNGSKDETGKIIQSFADKDQRIRFFRADDNYDYSINREFWEISHHIPKQDYFCILDADDYYEPEFFEKMLEFMQGYGLNVAACGTGIFNESGKEVGNTTKKQDIVVHKADEFSKYFPMLHWNLRQVWGKLYSGEIADCFFDDNRPDWSPVYGEDTCIALECVKKAGNFGILAQKLHHYRYSSKSDSYVWREGRIEADHIVLEKTREFVQMVCGNISEENMIFINTVYYHSVVDTTELLCKCSLMLNRKISYVISILEQEDIQMVFYMALDSQHVTKEDKKNFLNRIYTKLSNEAKKCGDTHQLQQLSECIKNIELEGESHT